MYGRILDEWVIANGMVVLNERSEYYTFSRQIDVDMTLMYGNMAECLFKWQVMSEWCISDHNTIFTQIMFD